MCWPCGLGNGVMKSGQIIRWLAAAAGLKPSVIEADLPPLYCRPLPRHTMPGFVASRRWETLAAGSGPMARFDQSDSSKKLPHFFTSCGIDQTRTLGSRYGGCECRSANEQWQGPLRPSFICQARSLRSRIYADLTCSEIRPSWTCGQSWIEVAVPEAALSFVERRQRHASVRLYCSDSLVKHGPASCAVPDCPCCAKQRLRVRLRPMMRNSEAGSTQGWIPAVRRQRRHEALQHVGRLVELG